MRVRKGRESWTNFKNKKETTNKFSFFNKSCGLFFNILSLEFLINVLTLQSEVFQNENREGRFLCVGRYFAFSVEWGAKLFHWVLRIFPRESAASQGSTSQALTAALLNPHLQTLKWNLYKKRLIISYFCISHTLTENQCLYFYI